MKIFRKIRQRLLSDNKLKKYLIYAIGEIFLVMVGILLALQVNNWNETRKTNKLEKDILVKLNADLKVNLDEISGIRNDAKVQIEAANQLLQFLESQSSEKKPLKGQLEKVSGGNIFNNANTTYINISNNLLNIIKDENIRLGVTKMYENDFYNIHIREKYENQILDNYYTPLTLKYLKYSESELKDRFGNTTKSINTAQDLNRLKKNDEFKNTLVLLTNQRETRLFYMNKTISELKILIDSIKKEIENK